MVGTLTMVTTHLEMRSPPWGSGPAPAAVPPRPGVQVAHMASVPVAFYRDLYRKVGEPWLWFVRLTQSDAELAAWLADPATDVYVLTVDGEAAGYAEIDRRTPGEAEIVYLGVAPPYIGLGLGRYLMQEALAAAWAPGVRRVWLHTCDQDHPRALDFYRSAGFVPYREETEVVDDPRALGLLPLTAGVGSAGKP